MAYATQSSTIEMNKQMEEWLNRHTEIRVGMTNLKTTVTNFSSQALNPDYYHGYTMSNVSSVSSPRIKPPDPPDRRPPSKKEFPKFDGTLLREWINQCEEFFWHNKTLPELRTRLASSHMEGKALEWNRNFIANNFGMFPSWTDYVIAIFARFGEASPAAISNTSYVRGWNIYGCSNNSSLLPEVPNCKQMISNCSSPSRIALKMNIVSNVSNKEDVTSSDNMSDIGCRETSFEFQIHSSTTPAQMELNEKEKEGELKHEAKEPPPILHVEAFKDDKDMLQPVYNPTKTKEKLTQEKATKEEAEEEASQDSDSDEHQLIVKVVDAMEMEMDLSDGDQTNANKCVAILQYSTPPMYNGTSLLGVYGNSSFGLEEKMVRRHDLELPSYIFLCNGITKRGMKLFFYDFEKKFLCGVYEASTSDTLDIETKAFEKKSLAQIGFKAFKKCYLMLENSFKIAIYKNYKGTKFKQELAPHQARSILSLFSSFTAPKSTLGNWMNGIGRFCHVLCTAEFFGNLKEMRYIHEDILVAGRFDDCFRSFEMANREKTSVLNIVMQLHKCCNNSYPSHVGEAGPLCTSSNHLVTNAGKMNFLDKLISKLKKGDLRVLIFSHMIRFLDMLEDYLVYSGYHYCLADGNTSGDEGDVPIEAYNKLGSEKIVFSLSTRVGELVIKISTTADFMTIYGSDWNPHINLQAQDYANKIGQKIEVQMFRSCIKSAIEEEVIERTYKKLVLDVLIIQQEPQAGHKTLNEDILLKMVGYDVEMVFMYIIGTLTEDIDRIIVKDEEATTELAKIGIWLIHVILLHGSLGCPKTTLDATTIFAVGVSFFCLSCEEIYSKYVGEREALFQNMFQRTRLGGRLCFSVDGWPSIIFFDENDVIVYKRAASIIKVLLLIGLAVKWASEMLIHAHGKILMELALVIAPKVYGREGVG